MKKKTVSKVMLTLLSTSILISAFNIKPAIANVTIISVYPQRSTAPIAEAFTISITITEVTNLYGWQFNLTFDPTILSVTDVSEASFLKQVAHTIFVESMNNIAGYVLVGTLFSPPLPPDGAYGSGTLANVTFEAKSVGETPLEFDKKMTKLRTIINLSNKTCQIPIEHATRDGYYYTDDGKKEAVDMIDDAEFGITWNLNSLPLFVMATVLFMATTIYLVKKKTKSETRLETA